MRTFFQPGASILKKNGKSEIKEGGRMFIFSFEELKSVYNVPYVIWSNYELNKEVAPKETSICYLANILSDCNGKLC